MKGIRINYSIIVPVFQDQNHLNQLLETLSQERFQASWELIVVDDGSSPPVSLPHTHDLPASVCRNDHQRGAAFSRNRGAQQARGEWLIFLSAFLSPPAGFLETLQTLCSQADFDYGQFPLEAAPGIRLDRFQRWVADQDARIPGSDQNLSIKHSLFTAAMIRRQVFLDLQGFDANMNHYGGHELDLSYRLDQAGYSRRKLLSDYPIQRRSVSTHQVLISRVREYGSVGLPALLEKHPELKNRLLPYEVLWTLSRALMIPKWLEAWLGEKIDRDEALSGFQYKLYLHVLMRNAWNAR